MKPERSTETDARKAVVRAQYMRGEISHVELDDLVWREEWYRHSLVDVLRRAWSKRRVFKWRKVGDRANGPRGDDVQMWRFHFLRIQLPRWLSSWRGIRIGVHKIVRPDNMSKGLHDHPWHFWSIVVWGGYVEVYAPDWLDLSSVGANPFFAFFRTRVRGWLSSGFHRAEYAHGIAALRDGRPCYTLFISSARVRPWGFPQIGEIADDRVD